MSEMKSSLIKILCKKAFKHSKRRIFKLTSGAKSKYYVDCKPTVMSSYGMFLVGYLMFEQIKDLDISSIGGLTFGADPIAAVTAFSSRLNGRRINYFSVRKNKKKHGALRWIEGDVNPGDNVVIVDDVVTTGRSVIKAISKSYLHGLDIRKVIVLVDRQEGGMKRIQNKLVNLSRNVNVPKASAIVTLDELKKEALKGE